MIAINNRIINQNFVQKFKIVFLALRCFCNFLQLPMQKFDMDKELEIKTVYLIDLLTK